MKVKLICPKGNCELAYQCNHSKPHKQNGVCYHVSSCPNCVNLNEIRKQKLKTLKTLEYEPQEDYQKI